MRCRQSLRGGVQSRACWCDVLVQWRFALAGMRELPDKCCRARWLSERNVRVYGGLILERYTRKNPGECIAPHGVQTCSMNRCPPRDAPALIDRFPFQPIARIHRIAVPSPHTVSLRRTFRAKTFVELVHLFGKNPAQFSLHALRAVVEVPPRGHVRHEDSLRHRRLCRYSSRR